MNGQGGAIGIFAHCSDGGPKLDNSSEYYLIRANYTQSSMLKIELIKQQLVYQNNRKPPESVE